MLAVGGDAEQPHQLVMIEKLRQLQQRLGAGHVEVLFGQPERDAGEEADGVAGTVAGLPGTALSSCRKRR